MRRHLAAVAVSFLWLVVSSYGAQTPPPVAATARQLAGTWTLVSVERPAAAGGRMTSLPFPRGLLVMDSAGHIFEGVQHGRPQGAPALGERQTTFATFS